MSRAVALLGWLAFALLVAVGGRLMLTACEVRPWPVFGGIYCPIARPPTAPLIAEQERQRVLVSRLHTAERHLAALPVCQPPPPAEKPPAQEPHAEEPPKPEELKIPTTLADLNGCWVSERGDIPLFSDDEREEPMGNVRMCFCFGDNGRGSIVEIYTDGVVCRGRVTASLSQSTLGIDQPALSCGTHAGLFRGHAKARITCHPDANGVALCDTQNLGRMRILSKDEKYRHAAEDQCAQHR
jgi:hypothetical protein